MKTMNRKIYMIPLLIVLMLYFNACDKSVLVYENPNSPTSTAFWNSPDEAESALNAVYHGLIGGGQAGLYKRWIFFRYDIATDEGHSISPWTELRDWTRFRYTNYNFGPGNVSTWSESYIGINRVNQVMTNVPDIEFEDQSRKNEILGEASFLRALYYWNLAVLWEDVPIVLEPSSPDDNPEQRPVEEVWAQIITDLTFAKENLPPSWPASEVGRATRGAAYALLGKVHMQRQDWLAARDAMHWLVEGDGAQYYDLVDNYEDNFRHTSENNIESVFELQFTDELTSGSTYSNRAQFYGPRGIGWSDGQANTWIIEESEVARIRKLPPPPGPPPKG
jgi:starch-binding outer membrane protein, SusD/RagB family